MSVTITDRIQALSNRQRPTVIGTVGIVATIAALTVTAGPLGAIAGLALGGASLVAPPLAVFGLGQAVILTLLPTPTPLQLGLVEASLFVMLIAEATPKTTRLFVPLSVVLFAALGGGTWYISQTHGLLYAATFVVLGVALLVYGGHRYERVVLGLAGGDTA